MTSHLKNHKAAPKSKWEKSFNNKLLISSITRASTNLSLYSTVKRTRENFPWLERNSHKISIFCSNNKTRDSNFHYLNFLFFFRITGSVRIPLQMSKCNHGANSTYLSMNSFNNNNLTVPGANEETTITTTDNLQPTTAIASQHWTRNLNGNSQRSSSTSWRVNKATLSLNLSDNTTAANQNSTDDLTPVNTNGGQKVIQSPFDYTTRYRKTWI